MSDEKGTILYRRLVDVLVNKNPADEKPFIDCLLKLPSLNSDIASLFKVVTEVRDEAVAERHLILACKLISNHPKAMEISLDDVVVYYTNLANYKGYFSNIRNIYIFADAVLKLYNLVEGQKKEELPQSLLTRAISSKEEPSNANKVFVDAFPAIPEKVELFTPLINLTLSYAISGIDLTSLSEEACKYLNALKNPEFIKKILTKPINSQKVDRDIALLLLRSLVRKIDVDSALSICFAFALIFGDWMQLQNSETQDIIFDLLEVMPPKDGENPEFSVSKQLSLTSIGLSKSIQSFDDKPAHAFGVFCKARQEDRMFKEIIDIIAPRGLIVLTWECGILPEFSELVEAVLKEKPSLALESLQQMFDRGVITENLASFAVTVYFDAICNKESVQYLDRCYSLLEKFDPYRSLVFASFAERVRAIASRDLLVKLCEFVTPLDLAALDVDGLPLLASLGRFLVVGGTPEDKQEFIAAFLTKVNKVEALTLPTTAPQLVRHFAGTDRVEKLKTIILELCEQERGVGYEVMASGLPNLTNEEIAKLELSIYNEKREVNEEEFITFYMNRFRVSQESALGELEKTVTTAMPSNAFVNIFVKHPSALFIHAVYTLIKEVHSSFDLSQKERGRLAAVAHRALPLEDKIREATVDITIDSITAIAAQADTEFTSKFISQLISTPAYCELIPTLLPRAPNSKALIDKAVESLAFHSLTTPSVHSYLAPIKALFAFGKGCGVMRRISKAVVLICKNEDDPIRALEFAAEAAKHCRESQCEPYAPDDSDSEFLLFILPFALSDVQTTRATAHSLLSDFFYVDSPCTTPAAFCDARSQFVNLARDIFKATGKTTTTEVVKVTSKKVQLWCVLATTASIDALELDFCKIGILLNLFKNSTTTIEYAFDTVLKAARLFPDAFANALMNSRSLSMTVRLIETLLIDMPSFPITLAKQAILNEKTPETLAKHLDIACAAHGAEEHPELLTAELMILGQEINNKRTGEDCLRAISSLTQTKLKGKADTPLGAIAVFRSLTAVLSGLEFATVTKVLSGLLECIEASRSPQLAFACGLLSAPMLCAYNEYAETDDVKEVIALCTKLLVASTTEATPRVVRTIATMLDQIVSVGVISKLAPEVVAHLFESLAKAFLDEKIAEFDETTTSMLATLFNDAHGRDAVKGAELASRTFRESISAVGPRFDNVDAFASVVEWDPAVLTSDDALQLLRIAVHTRPDIENRALDALRAAAGLDADADRDSDLDKVADFVANKTKEVTMYANTLIDGCTPENVNSRWLVVLSLFGLRVKAGVTAEKFLIALYTLAFDIIRAKSHPLEEQATAMLAQFD